MSQLRIPVNAAQRLAERALGRLGLLGLSGIGLLLLATLTASYVVKMQHDAELAQIRPQPSRDRIAPARAQHGAPPGVGEQPARFRSWLPRVETTAADLRKIFYAAQASHLVLAQGDYSLTPIDGSGGLQKMDVTLPVKERYGSIKNFVARVLNTLPHASLTDIQLERPSTAIDALDAQVHFTLYYQANAT